MTDDEARMLLALLDKYVVEYGGPDADKGEINPHKMTLAELKNDLEESIG